MVSTITKREGWLAALTGRTLSDRAAAELRASERHVDAEVNVPDAYTDGVPRSPERNQSATALMLSVSLIVCGCVPHVRMVSAPPEVTIALTQRPDAAPGCTISEPDKPTVLARQPFAFHNQTALTIVVVQNDGDFFFATIPPGHTSSAMVIRAAENYAYYTAQDPRHPGPKIVAPDVHTTRQPLCGVLFLRVVDR